MRSPSSSEPYSSLPGFLVGLILAVVGVLATLPSFLYGNVIVDDTLNHLVISQHFISQLEAGEWYPRWLGELNNGLGSPVMFFYGPISDYITALLHPLMQNDPEGWRQLGFSVSLALVCSGFSAYAWLRRLGNDRSALLGSIFYIGAPYHLMIDLYQRFAFAELWGFVWMPLVLWQVHAIADRCRGAWLRLSVCYALLIMTHLPTTLLFSVIPPLYSLCLAEKASRRRVVVEVSAGMVLGVGLSAIFLTPALLLQPYVQFKVMESAQFYYANNFLFYGNRFDPAFSAGLRYLGIVMGSTLLVSAGAYGLGKSLLSRNGLIIANFWLLISISAFFMALPISKLVWEMIPVLQKVQFPYRFGTVLTLSMVALLTLWLGAVGSLCSRVNRITLVIVSLIGLTQTVPVIKICTSYLGLDNTPSFIKLHKKMAPLDGPFKVLVEVARHNGYTFFLPKWTESSLINAQFGSENGFETLRSLSSIPDVSSIQTSPVISHLSFTRLTSRHLVLKVQSQVPVKLRVRQFYFPGWAATVRGQSTFLNVYPSPQAGLVQLDVPPGNHEIDLVLREGAVEQAGQMISIASAIIFLAGCLGLRYLAKEEPLSGSG